MISSTIRAARGESPASHRGRRGAPLTRRDNRAYREYVREEQRSQPGAAAVRFPARWGGAGMHRGRMQLEFHHGLLAKARLEVPLDTAQEARTQVFYNGSYIVAGT